MTAVETYYASGHCAVGSHSRCRGAYAGTPCQCACGHQPAEPEPEPELLGEIAAALTEGAMAAAVELVGPAHSAGVASVGYGGKLAQAVCSCGWSAPEARRRNHDAFEDARDHLAATLPADAVA